MSGLIAGTLYKFEVFADSGGLNNPKSLGMLEYNFIPNTPAEPEPTNGENIGYISFLQSRFRRHLLKKKRQ